MARVTFQGPVISPGGFAGSTGAALTGLLTGSAVLDFPSIAANSTQDLTIAVTGAALGDSVVVGAAVGMPAGILLRAFVSAVNTVTVRAANVTIGAIDPASTTFNVIVFKTAVVAAAQP